MAAKLTVHDTQPAPASPSADLIRQALKEETVVDDLGRRILIRKPGVLAQFRLTEAVGPEAAANQTYMQMINPLIYVAAINDEPVGLPASKREVEALLMLLDDPGLSVVMSWYMANVIAPTVQAIAEAERAAQLKN